MRFFIAFFLCCLSSFVWSAPWGAASDFDEQAVSGSPSSNPSGVGARYLLPQIVDGKPVRIWVTDGDPTTILWRKEEEREVSKYKRIINENYMR